MELALIKAINKAIEELVEMATLNNEYVVDSIHVEQDENNPTHLVVWLMIAGSATSKFSYDYAIYINKETYHSETDAY